MYLKAKLAQLLLILIQALVTITTGVFNGSYI